MMVVVARILLLGSVVAGLAVSPAGADPARPTEYRSTIDAIEPDVDGIEAEIIGGDAFINLTVTAGHTAVVEGYEGEPYLQFLDDGTVQENRLSPATYLNESRYGRAGEVNMPQDVAEGRTDDDPPEWRTVATNGSYAWHDHRVHWMSPDRPQGVEPGDVIQTQDVLLTVDDEPVAITVSVTLAEPISPLPWLALALVLLAVAVAAGWRRSLPVAAGGAVVASVLAVVAGQGELSSVPAGAGGSALVVIVPAIGLVAALAAGLLLWRGVRGLAGVTLLASAAALGGWALLRLTVLFKPVLPSDLPPSFDRAATAVAIGIAGAVAVLTFHSGAVAPPPLTDDVAPDPEERATT